MQASSTSSGDSNNNNNRSTFEKNKQLVERFLQTIKSNVTRVNSLDYINGYMRHWHLYEEKKEDEEAEEEEEEEEEQQHPQLALDEVGRRRKQIKKKTSREKYSNIIYRYDWLLYGNDIQTIQDRIIQFVIDKKKEGRGASAIDNYINPLQKFYWVNGVKGIDWKLVRSYRPEHVKKTHDREYYPEEVIAIEDKLDIRGKVVMGLMRGSGVRRGAEPSINIGDLIPLQTRYGKIYKIWVYRGSSEMYATACTPEIARRIDAYFEYRMRFGESCKLYRKADHLHEYYDGYEGDNIIQKSFKTDEPHLDPDAPLIREDFDRTDLLAAKHPKRLSESQISSIIRNAAIAAGIREVNKDGDHTKRHRVMITHGNRKLFKRRCRQAKVDPIVLERLLGHKSGNPKGGITKLMMTYDPEDWVEMQAEFEKAIPNLTITKDGLIQAELEKAKAQLRNTPKIEQIQAQQQSMQLQMKRLEENMVAYFEKYADEALKRAKPELEKIKDEKKRNAEESQLLWDSGVAAEVEDEEELEEEQEEEATKRAAAVSVDDPIANNIDACELLETVEE